MRAVAIVIVVAAFACGTKDSNKDSSDRRGGDHGAAPRLTGPMPVAFGDCAGPTVAWVSGPRPLPFTPAQAAGVWDAPVDDQPRAGAMLEDGAPGTRETARAGAKPERADVEHDSPLARQQAIEEARTAGVLGSVSLQREGELASLFGTGDSASGFDDQNIYGGLLGSKPGELSGGFGFARGGGPGGGTGWGTIGTGRYGTIGHGSGIGVGHGGRRTAAAPTVAVGEPNVAGGLDKAILRRYIRRNVERFQYCYEKELMNKPQLAGTVITQFQISSTGSVAQVSAHGVDDAVAACVAEVIKNITFPAPRGASTVQVNYPFIFHVAQDQAPAVGASTDLGPPPDSGPGSDAPAATGSAAPSAGSPGPGSAALPDAAPPRELFRTNRRPVDASKYVPGASNPLRIQEAALTECFRVSPLHHGAVVVALTYGAGGAVATATAHGLDDAPAAACVVAAAKQITRPGPGPAAQRCPVAFGEQPDNELPVIEIADALTFEGKTLATLASLRAADHRTIPELITALESRRKPVLAPSGPVVAIHGPNIIRPADATPMKVVVHVLASVLTIGDDLVLAARRGTAWKLLRPMTFPTIPVPFGTGGTWSPTKGRSRDASRVTNADHIVLSVLVTADKRVWIGQSRVDEHVELPAGPTQAAALLEALRNHKASAFFADRKDLEIAGEPDATYGDVVALIDAAEQAGFTDWQLTDPAGLATHPSP